MSPRRRRDWFRILRDLCAAGVSYAAVARKCDRHVTAVKGWADGADPKDTDARIVLALYAKHCPLKYVEHQREFEISAMLPELTDPGESYGLPFVGVRDGR